MTGNTADPSCCKSSEGLKYKESVGDEVLDAEKDPGFPSMYYFSVIIPLDILLPFYSALHNENGQLGFLRKGGYSIA
jgi:hypothetical protein